ncbi:MAG TPA: GNAT family N-acetyltransferase [Niabella sp.]|nr:GNAT family N-acetyltransferase [Niabella sp.]
MQKLLPFDYNRRQLVLHHQNFKEYLIEVRPLCLTRDISFIHKWVNMPYTQKFWQMPGSYEAVYFHYKNVLDNVLGYPVVFFFRSKLEPIALMEVYAVKNEEVGKLYQLQDEDIGIHFLMSPFENKISGLSLNVMLTGLSFLFSRGAKRIIGEPDKDNIKANELVKRAGFKYQKEIQMSYKNANLYLYEQEDFKRAYPGF